MAGEIKLNVQFSATKGKQSESLSPGQLSFDQATLGAHAPIVSVATSEADMPVGSVAAPGWLVMRNLDDTNYVTWGPSDAGSMVAVGRMKPGELAVFRLEPGVTIRWQANTAACKVKMLLIET